MTLCVRWIYEDDLELQSEVPKFCDHDYCHGQSGSHEQLGESMHEDRVHYRVRTIGNDAEAEDYLNHQAQEGWTLEYAFSVGDTGRVQYVHQQYPNYPAIPSSDCPTWEVTTERLPSGNYIIRDERGHLLFEVASGSKLAEFIEKHLSDSALTLNVHWGSHGPTPVTS